MSKTYVMEMVLRKFPITENIKWSEILAKTSKEAKKEPFKEYMRWLEKCGPAWEILAASGTSAKGKSTLVNNFFTQEEGDGSQRLCFGCGGTGHIRRNCLREEDPSQICGWKRL